MTPPAWSARDAGRSEVDWLRDAYRPGLARLNIETLAARYPRVLVVAPHPDDETLAVGGALAMLSAAGVQVDVLLLTDGEGAHGASTGLDHAAVRRIRSAEFDAALVALGTTGGVTRSGLPDSGLTTVEGSVVTAIRACLGADADTTLVLAPWVDDGHTDHDVAGRAAREVGRETGVACAFYPLWIWHWGDASQFDAATTVLLPLSVAGLSAKHDAMAAYTSQTGVFGRPAGEPALLHRGILRRFERVVETFIDPDGVLARLEPESADVAAPFDRMFDDGDDPWGVRTRWYERRRQSVIEAMLPHEALGRVLDVGCSTGALTSALAHRATSVLGVDASERALEIARRHSDPGGVLTWHQAAVPAGLSEIDGPFDLIVLSEIGYFLDGVDLLWLFGEVDRLLADDGVVVTANWQHPTRHIPLDGRFVDRQFCSIWEPTARYVDDDVVVSVHDGAQHRARLRKGATS